MKIQLDQNEIELAIKNYINEQVAIKPGQKIELAFTAGRGERGLTVDVDISVDTVAATSVPTGPLKREPETTAAAGKVERVNGRVVAQTTAKPTTTVEPESDIATANPADAVTAEAGDPAPFGESEQEADAGESSGRAGNSIFGSL